MNNYATPRAMSDMERLLIDLRRTGGEWEDDHEDILARWREARGEAGKGEWFWFARFPGEESYGPEGRYIGEAIAQIVYMEGEWPEFIQVVEACRWDDEISAIEGAEDGVERFAESRNEHLINRDEAIRLAKASALGMVGITLPSTEAGE